MLFLCFAQFGGSSYSLNQFVMISIPKESFEESLADSGDVLGCEESEQIESVVKLL